MPRYTFLNTQTQTEEVHWLKISELDCFLSDNPHLQQSLGCLNLADPTRLGIRKPDSEFRDVLKHVKSSHYKSTVNTW